MIPHERRGNLRWLPAICAILGIAGMVFAAQVTGATFYVDASVADDNGDGSDTHPKKHLLSGIRLLSLQGGDTLVLAPGRYAGPSNSITRSTILRNGRAGRTGSRDSYNVIRASVDGKTIISGALDLPLDASYLQFEGIKWDAHEEKKIAGRHIRFLRCVFKNGPSTGNANSLTIGTNDSTPGASDILIEDSWVYGPGGRYKLLVFNSKDVVLRRVVARHDGGWIPSEDNPQAGIAIYNSLQVHLQNVIVLDSTLVYPGWLGAIAHVQNSLEGTLTMNSVQVRGSVVLNIGDVGISYEGNESMSDVRILDTVIWKVARSALTLNGSDHHVDAERLTVGGVLGGHAINVFGGSAAALAVRRSIIASGPHKAFHRQRGSLTHADNDCYPRSGRPDCFLSGDVGVDPQANGLRFLPRVEDGSVLAQLGIGARIEVRTGASGTHYGEAGFADETAEPLWPWPQEDRLKEDLCEDGVSRGICGTPGTLTDYIWSFLGTRSPIHSERKR